MKHCRWPVFGQPPYSQRRGFNYFEGCWFYNGFSPIFALQRRGLMKGAAEQLQYIMRDEVMHCGFGIRAVRQIMIENDMTPDARLIQEMWEETEACEAGYAWYVLREPILGYTAEDHMAQSRYIANRRARQLGMADPFPGAEQTRLLCLDAQLLSPARPAWCRPFADLNIKLADKPSGIKSDRPGNLDQVYDRDLAFPRLIL